MKRFDENGKEIAEKSVTDVLEELNGNVKQLARVNDVAAAAGTPVGGEGAPPVVEKGLTGAEQEEAYTDPLRKSFEALAKRVPREFAVLGTTKCLDDPYGYLRQKNADGTYVITNSQLEQIIVGVKMVNDGDGTLDAKMKAGAMPMGEWMAKSGSPQDAIENSLQKEVELGGFGQNSVVMKAALDSSSGAALIRTDLEPMLHECFLRMFPGVDMLPKIPANGLVHSFVQQTAPGTAAFVSETGSLSATESTGTYGVATSTNIAVIASQRSIGLKMQWASQQSGMNFGLGGNRNTELISAIRAISSKLQTAIFQGNQNSGASGATLDDEDGLYNANSLTGLRQQLKDAGYSITKSGSESHLDILRRAVGQLLNAGADLNSIILFLSVGAQIEIDKELEQFFTVPKGTENSPFPTNQGGAGLRMLQDILMRSKVIPSGAQAAGIGYYTLSSVVKEDLYLMDPEGIKLPYLGSPTPVILELPTGYDNRLANTFIPFIMMGMALYFKGFNRKVRINQTTV